jgi:hypothetical protein
VTTACRLTLVLLFIYTAYLLVLALSVTPAVFDPLFSEFGPFEEMSIMLWVGLGILLLYTSRSPKGIAMAALSLLAAAREAELHKALTTMSILKSRFYLGPEVPWQEKLAGAAVVMAAIALGIYLMIAFYRFLLHDKGLATPVGQILLTALILLPITKVLDRMSSVLRTDFGVVLPQRAGQIVKALEEGMEMALPILFIMALLLFRTQQRDDVATASVAAKPE